MVKEGPASSKICREATMEAPPIHEVRIGLSLKRPLFFNASIDFTYIVHCE